MTDPLTRPAGHSPRSPSCPGSAAGANHSRAVGLGGGQAAEGLGSPEEHASNPECPETGAWLEWKPACCSISMAEKKKTAGRLCPTLLTQRPKAQFSACIIISSSPEMNPHCGQYWKASYSTLQFRLRFVSMGSRPRFLRRASDLNPSPQDTDSLELCRTNPGVGSCSGPLPLLLILET